MSLPLPHGRRSFEGSLTITQARPREKFKLMPFDASIIARARKLNRDAVEAVVNESFPAVARIAYALTGSDRAGNAVVTHIITRSLANFPKWRDEDEPQRWFLHHTIIASRSENGRDGGATGSAMTYDAGDPLVPDGAPPDFAAFIKAWRSLPPQQAEAFMLTHGESFNLRYVAVAMDCSTAAAQTHLTSADAALTAIAGANFPRLVSGFRQAYRALTPAGQVAVPNIGRIIRRTLWPQRLWKAIKAIFWIALIAAAAWIALRILPRIEY